MARIKGIKEVENLGELSLEDIYKDHPDFEKIANIFKDNFCFEEGDVKLCIGNIYERTDPEFISGLYKLFFSFVAKEDLSKVDKASRRALALQIVNSTLEIYDDTNQSNYTDFIEVIDEAKAKRINPYRLAIKSNIMTANVAAFEETLDALTGSYVDKHTGKLAQLFSEDETRSLIHKCASIAFKATKEKVQAVLDILGDLFYDRASGKYYVEPKMLIKKVPSLLAVSPRDMADTIDFLQDKKLFQMDRATLLKRIAESPSILCIDGTKMYGIQDELQKSFLNLLAAGNKFPSGAIVTKSQRLANNIVSDINNLTQLNRVDNEKIGAIASTLNKYLGSENAVACMHNMNVLSSNPDYLEFVLATLVRSEKDDGNKGLREAFVSSPFSFLNLNESTKKQIKTEKEREIERSQKEKFEIASMPEVNVNDEDYARLSAKVPALKKKGFTVEIIKKITEKLQKEQARLEQERKEAKEASQREWAEKIARERAEQKQRNKRMSRREANRNANLYSVNQSKAAEPAKINQKVVEKKTLEEIQAQRRAALKFDLGSEIEDDLYFSRILSPIIAGFPKENRALFNKICNVVKQMSYYEMLNLNLSKAIETSAHNWKAFMYDTEAGDVRDDLLEALKNKTKSGKSNLGKIVDDLKYFYEEFRQIEYSMKEKSPLIQVQDTLARCCKNSSVDWPISIKPTFDEKKNQQLGQFERLNPIEIKRRVGEDVKAYLASLDPICEKTYGYKLNELIPDGPVKTAYNRILTFLSQPLTPDTCARLGLMLCQIYYCETIFNSFVNMDYCILKSISKQSNPLDALNEFMQTPLVTGYRESKRYKDNLSVNDNVLLVNDGKLIRDGYNPKEIYDFADIYKEILLDTETALFDVKHFTSSDGDLRIKFYEDEKLDYILEYKKGEHVLMDYMPEFLFKRFRSKEAFATLNVKSEENK